MRPFRPLLAALLVAPLLLAACDERPSTAASEPPADAPEGMVWVPAGEFVMGSDNPSAMPNEGPERRVRLDGFWMDATPVTNAQFQQFVEATGYVTTAERPIDWEEMKLQLPPGTPRPPDEVMQPGSLVFTPSDAPVDLANMANWWTWTPGACWRYPEGPGSTIEGREDHPVVQVSWDDAAAYAKWVGKRLPTEAEWEYAAWGGEPQNTRYAWGDNLRQGGRWMCNTYTGRFPMRDTAEDGFAGTSPVKSFPANELRLYDMAGNVWNWTADLYRADAHQLSAAQSRAQGRQWCVNPKGPASTFDPARAVPGSVERVIKGGSFLCSDSYCESYRPPARRGSPPDTGTSHVGFRCVRDASRPPA